MHNVAKIVLIISLSACSGGKLTAIEAKEKAEQAIIEPHLNQILQSVAENTTQGKFNMVFVGNLNPLVGKKLESLGYKIIKENGIITISWS